MAAKKKSASSSKSPRTPKVAGTTRTHRAVDARELRESVKQKHADAVKVGNGETAHAEVIGDGSGRKLPEAIVDGDGVCRTEQTFEPDDVA